MGYVHRQMCRCLRRAEALIRSAAAGVRAALSLSVCWETNWFSAELYTLNRQVISAACSAWFPVLPSSRSLREGCQSVYMGRMKISCQYVSSWFYSATTYWLGQLSHGQTPTKTQQEATVGTRKTNRDSAHFFFETTWANKLWSRFSCILLW